MGNAVEELKNAANEVTLSNDEDGIAVVVERYLK
jgi:hydroxymethylpyrimidine pyrophosphatase-like HAD family hydrolase